jgi:hypothetical protein
LDFLGPMLPADALDLSRKISVFLNLDESVSEINEFKAARGQIIER